MKPHKINEYGLEIRLDKTAAEYAGPTDDSAVEQVQTRVLH